MKLLTIIVNYKTPDMTLDAAQAALRQLENIKGDWRLVIVDNDSQDESFDKLSAAVNKHIDSSDNAWKKVSVIQSGHNGGFGAGNNFAIRQFLDCKEAPDYFYVLNSDAFPEDQSIQLLVDQLDEHQEVGLAGSYIHGPDGEPHTTAFRFPTIFSEFEGSVRLGLITKILKKYVVPMGIPEETLEVDWLAGASMMVRREVVEQVGLFDEEYFLYFEETDLCYRAKEAGWLTHYVRESSVSHIGSVSTGMKEWQRIPKYWLDSRRRYFIKRHGFIYYGFATQARILGELIWKLRVKLEGKQGDGPEGFVYDLFRHFMGIKPAR